MEQLNELFDQLNEKSAIELEGGHFKELVADIIKNEGGDEFIELADDIRSGVIQIDSTEIIRVGVENEAAALSSNPELDVNKYAEEYIQEEAEKMANEFMELNKLEKAA